MEASGPARCSGSFRLLVVAAAFRGKGLLQRHRWVWPWAWPEGGGAWGGGWAWPERPRPPPLSLLIRLVNEALGAELERIHALEQRTLTPEQWAEERRRLA